MDNGYRAIKEGDIRQCGDEFRHKSHNSNNAWHPILGNYGMRYSDYYLRKDDYRRPIAKDEPDLQMLFALAPVDATHAWEGIHIKSKNGSLYRLFAPSFPCSGWQLTNEIPKSELKEIPSRERELNRLADNWEDIIIENNNMYGITNEDVIERRALRHPDATDTDDSLKSDISNIKSEFAKVEQDMLFTGSGFMKDGKRISPESVYLMLDVNDTDSDGKTESQWLPEQWFGKEPESQFWVAKVDEYGTHWNHDGPHSTFASAFDSIPLLKSINKVDKFAVTQTFFRPIKTAEQLRKARYSFISNFDLETNELVLGKIFDYLNKSGVDLSPLAEKDKSDE